MSLPNPEKVPDLGFYHHYKHDPNGPVNNYAYEVVGVGYHTESDCRPGEEHFLIYRPLYEASVYKTSINLGIPCFDARPLKMWMENIEKEGKTFPRFKKITDQDTVKSLEEIRDKMY